MNNTRLYPLDFEQYWVLICLQHALLELSSFMLLGSFNFHSIHAGLTSGIAHANLVFHTLYYNIIYLTSLKITQAFHLLLGFQ